MRLPLALSLGLLLLVTGTRAQESNNNTLSVTGSSTVSVTADVATVSLTISTTRQSVKEACDVVSEATNAVTTGVGEAVSDAEVSTTGLSVSQNITYSSEGKQTVNGYICANSLNIKVTNDNATDLGTSIGAAVDAAIAAGGNLLSVGSMSASLSPGLRSEVTNQARAAAVEDALEIAKTLAKAAKVTLGDIKSISDTNVTPAPIPFAAAAPMASSDMASTPTPVTIGQQEVTAAVSIVYDFTV